MLLVLTFTLTLYLFIFFFFILETKKEKADGINRNLSITSEEQANFTSTLPPPGGGNNLCPSSAGSGETYIKPERPSTLAPAGKLNRRLICYHSEHCKFDYFFFQNILHSPLMYAWSNLKSHQHLSMNFFFSMHSWWPSSTLY